MTRQETTERFKELGFDNPVDDAGKLSLRGADLSGADLERADLSGIILAKAYLRRANLGYADLERADLSGTDLSWARLGSANLYHANLKGADLSFANLYHANLKGADLKGANMSATNLEGTNLCGVKYDKRTTWPIGFNLKGHERERLEKEWVGVPRGAISRAKRDEMPQPTAASLSRTEAPGSEDTSKNQG